eukprot:3847267-Pyramimonas_sp.AAC.1
MRSWSCRPRRAEVASRSATLYQGIADMAKKLFAQAVEHAKSAQAAHAAQEAKLAGKRRKRNDGEAAAGGPDQSGDAGSPSASPGSVSASSASPGASGEAAAVGEDVRARVAAALQASSASSGDSHPQQLEGGSPSMGGRDL